MHNKHGTRRQSHCASTVAYNLLLSFLLAIRRHSSVWRACTPFASTLVMNSPEQVFTDGKLLKLSWFAVRSSCLRKTTLLRSPHWLHPDCSLAGRGTVREYAAGPAAVCSPMPANPFPTQLSQPKPALWRPKTALCQGCQATGALKHCKRVPCRSS